MTSALNTTSKYMKNQTRNLSSNLNTSEHIFTNKIIFNSYTERKFKQFHQAPWLNLYCPFVFHVMKMWPRCYGFPQLHTKNSGLTA